MRLLDNHTSPETAYIIESYPWRWNKRTKRRCWIQTTRYGQREVAQCLDPKTGEWCKPKYGTYAPIKVLVLLDNGKVDAWIQTKSQRLLQKKGKIMTMPISVLLRETKDHFWQAFYPENGEACTHLEVQPGYFGNIYPANSHFSAEYEHVGGICFETKADAISQLERAGYEPIFD